MNKKKFDWYKVRQRFSIRKYHFGAASVILGTLLSLGVLSSDASANNTNSEPVSSSDVNSEKPTSERTVSPASNTAFRNAPQENELTILNIDVAESTVTILTKNAVKVEATLDGQKIALSGADGSYSFERPLKGGALSVKVTDKNGLEKTQTTQIEPTTVNGNINANRPGIDVTNHFDLNGITKPSQKGLPSETNVLYAGTELESISGSTITLNSTSWTQLASGWQKDGTYPLAGHYVLAFQNPQFYENIDSISVNNVQFKKYNGDPSTWAVELLTKTFSTGLIGTKYENKVIVKLKSGKTLQSLGLANTPISFTSGWVTGKDYSKKEGPNKLVAESIDNSWFSTNNKGLNDSDRGVRNNFTGTKKDAASNVPPILKVLPDLHGGSLGVTSSIKALYMITPSGAYGLLGPANTYQTLPYFIQKIPKELLPFINTKNISIYQSNSNGKILENKQRLYINSDNEGVVDTRTNNQLTIAGKSSQADVNRVRNFFRDNLFNYTLGQPLYVTVEYGLKKSKDSVELAKELNKIIQEQNGTLNFEGWMGRETKSGTAETGANEPGVLRGSYANAFLDTNLLTLNAPDKQTYDVSY
ncbi:YSIRK-type signal peptide-containing protein [Gemella sp. GH3]|uniref:YSIRK-type signal peptide-containing protein n=1 Tax=unclassified Gemella TaxID=2624949 RepID=UPI0015D03D5C|nr:MULTISPECIES: YSIRK-type signal peptide-containing protein [unclassified Gemella]MBF0714040.1 YSIRK-type signal peptide-containing protein [Gemella sp. GH3.1]NYS50992.1 YSIRK-type signal peptide-containing protein [Gemella sp. GH3]